jgi:hypothetical protein
MAQRLAQNSGEQQPLRRVGAPRGRPFKKGHSGNPGGRPKEAKDVQALARAHTAEAVQTLVEVMRTGSPDRARAAAAESLLDRGWGRAPQTVEVSTENDEPLLPGYTTEDLIVRMLQTKPHIARKVLERIKTGEFPIMGLARGEPRALPIGSPAGRP